MSIRKRTTHEGQIPSQFWCQSGLSTHYCDRVDFYTAFVKKKLRRPWRREWLSRTRKNLKKRILAPKPILAVLLVKWDPIAEHIYGPWPMVKCERILEWDQREFWTGCRVTYEMGSVRRVRYNSCSYQLSEIEIAPKLKLQLKLKLDCLHIIHRIPVNPRFFVILTVKEWGQH